MQYWLVKSEPETWSWDMQVNKGVEPWDGVRNYTARNYMKKMKLGDLVFFYHSGKERQIVGVVKVVKEYYDDPSEPKFGMVDVETVVEAKTPLTLKSIKEDANLSDMLIIKQSRLSVMPVSCENAKYICQKLDITLNYN